MSSSDLRPAWYMIRRRGHFYQYVNAIHLPYTVLHLSFVVMGFALAPSYYLGYSLAVLLAFFLAMGVGAHALDLLAGDPLRLSLPENHLRIAAAASIWGAFAIGWYVCALLGIWWYLSLVFLGPFIVAAYNLEWFGGRFHTDHWFAFSWGAFPFACAYVLNHHAFTYQLVLGMIFCYAISRLQRILSTRARLVRRKMSHLEGWYDLEGEPGSQITKTWLIEPSERALMWLCVAVPILAVLLLFR